MNENVITGTESQRTHGVDIKECPADGTHVPGRGGRLSEELHWGGSEAVE